jgi:YesN/AraC family two-component response regulator
MVNIEELMGLASDINMLYVEDEPTVREETLGILSVIFGNVDIAEDGLKGLEKYQNGNYDIVLTDINMPNMNGLEMSDEICEINPRQIIVVLSAHEELDYLEKLMELGVDKFILKPLDIDELVETFYKTILRLNKEKNE